MWTYIHTPGIHTNTKSICADYTMVSKTNKQTTTARKEKKKRGKRRRKKVRAKIYKQSYKHTFTTATKTEKVNRNIYKGGVT